ncbi:DUF3429 domain-containing protein [Histidinibacterium aquaticum]|uniref:DUF3429 domain-containing protein n=1 Tax=Histidinibacterium aquaticum TaxID=2613962 RepID=A0A5J5GIP4_9RHOB|nr:DUF3429 domain-containing protein [Histidinibacterium aquaticum]KAA9007997.1 DUF3429 domain-containing protein [Histidinibacterium aquaticum]
MSREISVEERRSVPLDGLLLGYGPVLLFPALALVAWLTPAPWAIIAIFAGQIVGAALLCFFAGVRRGLSFRTEGGPKPRQIAVMLALFFGGLVALVLPPALGLLIVLVAIAAMGIFEPRAAERGEVPLYFARLRPPQMTIAVVGLAMLLVAAL